MQQSESTVAHDPYAAKQPVRTGMLRGLVLLMCLMAQGSAGGAFQRWLNRLRVGVFTVVGLYLLGAPIDRALTVGVMAVVAAILGFSWPLVNTGSALLLSAGLVTWALNLPIR